jgi:hypothetical protein
MVPPKVFISYSHDSAAHKQWVLDFATTLRSRGVDAILDQWDLKPGDDLPHFMEQSLESADYAVMICTKRYVTKANAGEGGVGYEKMIMTSSSLAKISDNKVIPIVRENSDTKVPTFLKSKLYIDFIRDEDIEYSLDELLRHLLNAPLYEKPEIGKNPFRPLNEARPDRTSDGIKQVITIVAKAYDDIKSININYNQILRYSDIPRLKFDKYFAEAVNQGLLEKDIMHHVKFTNKGLLYAEDHGLAD